MLKKIIILITLFSLGAFAQGTNDDVEKVLLKFKNYRFGNVYVWKVRDANTIGEIVKSNDPTNQKKASSEDFEAAKSKYDPGAIGVVERIVEQELPKSDVALELTKSGYDVIPEDDLNVIYQYYVDQIVGQADNKVTIAYIITMPPNIPGNYPEEIIGMIVRRVPFNDQPENLNDALEIVTPEEAYSYREMKLTEIDTSEVKIGGNITNLYELAEVYFQQDNVINKTLEAQGLTDPDIIWGDIEKGVAEPLISYNAPYEVLDYQIQKFKRISSGEPTDYIQKNMEVFVGPDRISWKKYPLPYIYNRKGEIELDSLGNPIIDDFYGTNEELPEIGVELKYGVESINMPSFSSERLTLNLIWRQLKFGIILPTNGWSTVAEDIYSQDRTLTYGGFGFNFEADFDVPIINRSDVFHIDGAYVSSDAEPADFLSDFYDNLIDEYQSNPNETTENNFLINAFNNPSYLIRANATAHYTFGMSIDQNNLLRFSLGGTVYNVERWGYELTPTNDDLPSDPKEETFVNFDSETVGGLSTKIDFMATGGRLPWGASVQYFDESFFTNIFAQFPIIDNMLFLKVNAVGRFDIKNQREAWETPGFFQPMVNLIYIF